MKIAANALGGSLFLMLFTGLAHKRTFHIGAGILFTVLWTGTFITGIFLLRHELP